MTVFDKLLNELGWESCSMLDKCTLLLFLHVNFRYIIEVDLTISRETIIGNESGCNSELYLGHPMRINMPVVNAVDNGEYLYQQFLTCAANWLGSQISPIDDTRNATTVLQPSIPLWTPGNRFQDEIPIVQSLLGNGPFNIAHTQCIYFNYVKCKIIITR